MHRNKLLLSALLLSSIFFTGCRQRASTDLRVGVTPGPAEDILNALQPSLAQKGVRLQVVHFTDYIQPNLALAGHDLDANLYQNAPFLDQFNHDHATHFITAAKVYVPLMAIYPGKSRSLNNLANGARVSIPNDPVNQARALYLLQTAGLLVLSSDAGNRVSISNIAGNPRHLRVIELDASQLPRSRGDVDLSVINANFALDAGLNPTKDSLFHEPLDSIYANVLVINQETQSDPRVAKLATALRSDVVKSFISSHYRGAIYPAS